MDMDISANVKLGTTNLLDLSMPMTVKADINLQNIDKSVMSFGGKLNMTVDPSLADGGDTSISQDINYYFTNGTYYMDMGEQGKYKMAMSFDDVLSGTDLTSMNTNVPVSAIESFTEDKSGLTIKYNMDSVFSSDLFDELLGSMLDGVSIKVHDMKVTAKAVDNLITDTTISGTVDITAEGETISATLNATAKVTATGDAVKITLPTDLASYQDLPLETN